MKIKALVSFVGAVDMNMGEVREADDKLASSLISCGYAANVTENENINADDPAENTGGDADENIGNNSRKRKKSAEN